MSPHLRCYVWHIEQVFTKTDRSLLSLLKNLGFHLCRAKRTCVQKGCSYEGRGRGGRHRCEALFPLLTGGYKGDALTRTSPT